jgi:very-short-patch-repair endonuclease
MPVPGVLFPQEKLREFCSTLGASLVAGAVEMLELQPEELAFFHHPDAGRGAVLVFYETAPGGAGYLDTLAARFPEWCRQSWERLTAHDCVSACYDCLKTYRNQPLHQLLDKRLVLDPLLQFASHEATDPPTRGRGGDGSSSVGTWLATQRQHPPTRDTEIERRLQEAIRSNGRLPEPVAQREFRKDGRLITVADFAYENERIAIYCDSFAWHGNAETLVCDANKRNELQSQGWLVLTFWSRTILRQPALCEEQIWRAWNTRQIVTRENA